MLQTLDDAQNNNDPAAIRRLELAYGPTAKSHINDIRQHVQNIDAGTLPISSKPPEQVDNEWKSPIAAIAPFDYRASETDPVVTHPVELGSMWNDRPPQDLLDTSTLLHEAAHVFNHASDDNYKTSRRNAAGDMVPFALHSSGYPPGAVVNKNGGCTLPFSCGY